MTARLARVTLFLSAAVVAVANAESNALFVGQGYEVSVTNKSASGRTQYGYTTNLDGKESKVSGTNANADTLTVKRIGARTLESVSRKGGKVTITQRNAVSADGKTRTVTTTGTDAQGQKVNNVAVFERQ